jgi:glycosidase
MPWRDEPGGGFTRAEATPWLPFGDLARNNVADQREDPASTLRLTRDLIAIRRERADLRGGAYATLPAPDGAWAFRRGDGTAVALNLSSTAATVDGIAGTVLAGTDRGRDGATVDGTVELGPWEGVLVDVSPTGSGR